MAIRYTKLFNQECENKLGITRAIVKDVIEKPSKEQRLTSQGLTIILFSKRIRKEDCLIVTTHVDDKDIFVDLVFRVKDSLVRQAKTDLPFTLMRLLAYKLGLPIRVGEQESKFIYNEVIPISSSDIKKAIRIPNPERHPVISIIWIRIIQNNMGSLAQCALAFCIDTKKYRAWMRD